MKIRDRIKELRRVPASQLIPNPRNWRTHPKSQQDALKGVLSEIGFADAAIARELPDGTLMLIDGHLRAETATDSPVPVLILDVTEEEADKLLVTLDPLAAMADTNAEALEAVLTDVETNSEAVSEMLSRLAHRAGLFLEGAGGAEDEAADGDAAEAAEEESAEPAGVRMVQLFLDETNIEEFQDRTARLAEEYDTGNLTDTVLEAVRRASLHLYDQE
jgi:ParB-like chromosome segregation protein Spo0J